MLVESHRIDELSQIGDDITITILEIEGQQVRKGGHAPQGVSVHREEIHVRVM